MHICPLTEGPKPHVGGPISEGNGTVLIDGKPAAVVGSVCTCVGPPDAIAAGSSTVYIGGMPAARKGDPTVHGGVVMGGSAKVIIGG
jgi:uncharacterized Zn-binding protein involved in type VI secretion